MTDSPVFTLLQVVRAVARRIDEVTRRRPYWIKAEIASVREHGGHAYLSFVQHDHGQRVAVMEGVVWASDLERIRSALGAEAAGILKSGSEVLFLSTVEFHPVHGLKLYVTAVDLDFSLGQLEARRRQAIATLKAEGLFDLNRVLAGARVMQRVALIASATSAAYQDFVQHLGSNPRGYRFHVRLFDSQVQGAAAASALCRTLAMVDPRQFDVVILVRGGGSRLDLEPFNDLDLCRAIARMRIPVMTGIGHEEDVSVVDMVAWSRHKTPTAVAEHLIARCSEFERLLHEQVLRAHRVVVDVVRRHREHHRELAETLRQRPLSLCRQARGSLNSASSRFVRLALLRLAAENQRLALHRHAVMTIPLGTLQQVHSARVREFQIALELIARRGMHDLRERLNEMKKAVEALGPERALTRGFSITRVDGRPITDADGLDVGDLVETTLARGRIWSVVNRKQSNG